jgi:2-polyprenyl-3-methyl-5-hydroxy-6-metoxy-1,4-benzoquinol methylase
MSSLGSLSYRKNKADIWNGKLPSKYTRLLPFISGRRILEIGAAEGVLALAMAEHLPEAQIVALEMSEERTAAAKLLHERWLSMGRKVGGALMVNGDIRQSLDLLEGVDTLVAVRVIYHLGDAIQDVFNVVGALVPKVVLCGNPNRAARAAIGTGDPFDYYAGIPGMTQVLQTAGYRIDTIVMEGDPIVVGRR